MAATTFLLLALLLVALHSSTGAAHRSHDLSQYKRYPSTDIPNCQPTCIRVGDCGDYPPNPKGPCNVTLLAQICDATCGCIAFNTNGWLKGCANSTCGSPFEPSDRVDTYVKGTGEPAPAPSTPPPAVDDEHYPDEEVLERQAASPVLVSADDTSAVLLPPSGSGQPQKVVVGGQAFGFVLVAVLLQQRATVAVVLERSFARWGFLSVVEPLDGEGRGGEIARLRKGTGQVSGFSMPNFNAIIDHDCVYYGRVYGNATDYIGGMLLAESDGEPTFQQAIKYMPPQRDYAAIGGIEPYQKYSVSPDGRIKTADDAIYTPSNDVKDTGPGVLVFDPATVLPQGHWPATNWTFAKSALVGNHLRVVSTIGFDNVTAKGYEQLAFAPASDVNAEVYVRLRATQGW